MEYKIEEGQFRDLGKKPEQRVRSEEWEWQVGTLHSYADVL